MAWVWHAVVVWLLLNAALFAWLLWKTRRRPPDR